MFLAQFGHLPYLLVGEEHDAAPLAHPVYLDMVACCRVDDRSHRLGAFYARYLGPVLSPVREALGRGGKTIGVA